MLAAICLGYDDLVLLKYSILTPLIIAKITTHLAQAELAMFPKEISELQREFAGSSRLLHKKIEDDVGFILEVGYKPV